MPFRRLRFDGPPGSEPVPFRHQIAAKPVSKDPPAGGCGNVDFRVNPVAKTYYYVPMAKGIDEFKKLAGFGLMTRRNVLSRVKTEDPAEKELLDELMKRKPD